MMDRTPPPKWLCYRCRRAGARPSTHLSFARTEARSVIQCSIVEVSQLQLEKGAQTTKKSGAVFALFGRLILGEMSLFDNALRLHFSFCQQLTQLIETF